MPKAKLRPSICPTTLSDWHSHKNAWGSVELPVSQKRCRVQRWANSSSPTRHGVPTSSSWGWEGLSGGWLLFSEAGSEEKEPCRTTRAGSLVTVGVSHSFTELMSGADSLGQIDLNFQWAIYIIYIYTEEVTEGDIMYVGWVKWKHYKDYQLEKHGKGG